ncbi:MAG TPA: MBL fold metallo-hydrolase [Opitutae bacterium]|nr:MBL fold metallo-hydrolase [Opitutae bacterium]|tara:strand:+ start:13833 stop:14465 length:633 start_codon:yes stop_codon:yes gene_type:complete
MLIISQELPPIGTNAIALINTARSECIIIDAPQEAYNWAIKIARDHECEIVALILTHGHWDHIIDAHKFSTAGIQTFGHREDGQMFADPTIMMNYALPEIELLPVEINQWVQHGQHLDILGVQMEILHVPGHCPGNILVYLPCQEAAIVGDVIFSGSVGRYDLPGGDFEVLQQSIRKEVYSLPDSTTLYPGHGPTTTVGHEKVSNPFVRA